jgi:hypothetical protein
MTVNEKEASKATAAMLLLLSNKNPLKKFRVMRIHLNGSREM